jgi:AcrR family transcriptional regulator
MALQTRRRKAPAARPEAERPERRPRRDKLALAPSENGPAVRRAVEDYKKSAYRDAILDAAEAVFLRVGYSESKMADIAAQAGFAVGTLYNYFESKQAVFAALVERGCGQMMSQLGDADEPGAPLERLNKVLERCFSHIERRGAMFALYVQLGAVAEFDIGRVGGQQAEDMYVHFLRRLEALLSEAAEQKLVRDDVAPAVLAAGLAGMSNAAVFTWLRGGRRDPLVPRAAATLELFLQGASAR